MNFIKKRKTKLFIVKSVIVVFEVIAAALVVYLVALPFYPALKYEYSIKPKMDISDPGGEQLVRQVTADTLETINHLPGADYAVSPNRIIIPEIGVNAPIVETASAEYGLSKGSWLVPETSTPDKGGNTVITGHRFKYLPPNNLTFYLLDKLKLGDMFSVIWHNQTYYYRVTDSKIVDKTEVSILDQTEKPTVTLYTCDPIYSTAHRLVVTGELAETK